MLVGSAVDREKRAAVRCGRKAWIRKSVLLAHGVQYTGREEHLIPSLILAGFVVGRWWIVPVAMVVWPALMIGTGVDSGIHVIAAGSLIAVPNVALGVALHRGARR